MASGEPGQLTEAVGHLREALASAREPGNPRWEATALQFLGIAHGRAARFDDSRRYLDESLAISQRHRDTYTEILTLIVMARVALGRGDDTARPTARAARAAAREHRMTHHVADSLTLLGEIELAAGRSAAAAGSPSAGGAEGGGRRCPPRSVDHEKCPVRRHTRPCTFLCRAVRRAGAQGVTPRSG